MPSFELRSPLVAQLMAEGPWGIALAAARGAVRLEGLDPLVHSVFWSLFLNSATLVVGVAADQASRRWSGCRRRLFVDLFRRAGDGPHLGDPRLGDGATTCCFVAQRVLGRARPRALFDGCARPSDADAPVHRPTGARARRLDRRGFGPCDAEQGRLGRRRLDGRSRSRWPTRRSRPSTIRRSWSGPRRNCVLRRRSSRTANRRLRELDSQKDEFLSQVSHEVRTPMASIRSFAEILMDDQHWRLTSGSASCRPSTTKACG